jgi:hypothetical protein
LLVDRAVLQFKSHVCLMEFFAFITIDINIVVSH